MLTILLILVLKPAQQDIFRIHRQGNVYYNAQTDSFLIQYLKVAQLAAQANIMQKVKVINVSNNVISACLQIQILNYVVLCAQITNLQILLLDNVHQIAQKGYLLILCFISV